VELNDQLHAPAALSMGKIPVTHWMARWVDPRVGLDAVARGSTRLYPKVFRPSQ